MCAERRSSIHCDDRRGRVPAEHRLSRACGPSLSCCLHRRREFTMRRRAFAPGVFPILAVLLPAVCAFAQAPVPDNAAKSAETSAWIQPRTPDGQPDLQGNWTNHDATPLERPKALEGRQFLTEKEVNNLRRNAGAALRGRPEQRLCRGGQSLSRSVGESRYLPESERPPAARRTWSTGSSTIEPR